MADERAGQVDARWWRGCRTWCQLSPGRNACPCPPHLPLSVGDPLLCCSPAYTSRIRPCVTHLSNSITLPKARNAPLSCFPFDLVSLSAPRFNHLCARSIGRGCCCWCVCVCVCVRWRGGIPPGGSSPDSRPPVASLISTSPVANHHDWARVLGVVPRGAHLEDDVATLDEEPSAADDDAAGPP